MLRVENHITNWWKFPPQNRGKSPKNCWNLHKFLMELGLLFTTLLVLQCCPKWFYSTYLLPNQQYNQTHLPRLCLPQIQALHFRVQTLSSLRQSVGLIKPFQFVSFHFVICTNLLLTWLKNWINRYMLPIIYGFYHSYHVYKQTGFYMNTSVVAVANTVLSHRAAHCLSYGHSHALDSDWWYMGYCIPSVFLPPEMADGTSQVTRQ